MSGYTSGYMSGHQAGGAGHPESPRPSVLPPRRQASKFSAGRGRLQCRGRGAPLGPVPWSHSRPPRDDVSGASAGERPHHNPVPTPALLEGKAGTVPRSSCLPVVLFTFTDKHGCDHDLEGRIQGHHMLPTRQALSLTSFSLVSTHIKLRSPFLPSDFSRGRHCPARSQGACAALLDSRAAPRQSPHPCIVGPPPEHRGLPPFLDSQGLCASPPSPQPPGPGCLLGVVRPAQAVWCPPHSLYLTVSNTTCPTSCVPASQVFPAHLLILGDLTPCRQFCPQGHFPQLVPSLGPPLQPPQEQQGLTPYGDCTILQARPTLRALAFIRPCPLQPDLQRPRKLLS